MSKTISTSPAAAANGAAGAAVKVPVKKTAAKAAAVKPVAAKQAVAKPAAVKAAAAKPVAKKAGIAAVTPAGKAALVKSASKEVSKPAAKFVAKAVSKSAVKPAALKSPAAKTVVGKTASEAKEKARKPKLVRDSFTMPEAEYAVLGQVKKACLKAGFDIKKSELLRIGVALISKIDMTNLQKVLASLPQLKTGRPKKG